MNANLNAVKSGWLQAKACHGVPTDIFFPEGSGNRDRVWAQARAICESCPVIEDCRQLCDDIEAAPDARVYGMWAGETPNERRYRRYQLTVVEQVHGTRSMWTRGCRCEPCVKANYARVSSYGKRGNQ